MANENNQSVDAANTQNNDTDYNAEVGNSQVCYVIDAETGDIVVSQPEAGTAEILDLELGGNYVFDFPPSNVASLIEQDGNLVIEFTDNSSLVLNNFGSATTGGDAATLVTDAGAVVNTTEFIETLAQIGSQEIAENLNDPRCEIRKVFAEDTNDIEIQEVAVVDSPQVIRSAAQDLADIAPAAGEPAADPTAEDLANIEPEAGQGALGATGRGFGFQSSFEGTGVIGLDDTGPLDPTALNYDLPEFTDLPEEETPVAAATTPPVDPTPQLVNIVPLAVDETDLDDAGTESAVGQANVDFGADAPGTFSATDISTFSFTGSAANGQLTSCGNPIDVTLVGDQYVGTANGQTIFTMDIAQDGSYVFNLLGQVDHADTTDPNDVITLNFGITAEDNNGDTVAGNIPVQLFDDGPEILTVQDLVTDETALDDNGTESNSGQITVDFGLDDGGTIMVADASTFTAGGSLAGGALTSEGNPVTVTTVGNQFVGTANGQTIFTMTVNNDGSYTFDLLGTLDHADTTNPDDVINLGFGVKVTDKDGDSVETVVNVDVRDDGPEVLSVQNLTTDETILDGSGSDSASGQINVDFGADSDGTITPSDISTFTVSGSLAGGQLTSEGNPVTVTVVGNQYIGTANGQPVFTMTINNDGSYTFDLTGTLDHADGTDPNDVINLGFNATVTDGDGDSVETTINVSVNDDGPVAADDVITLAPGQANATGNVLTNDDAGADDSDVAVLDVSFGGTTVAAGNSIAGQYGTLTVNDDGSYTYTPNGTNTGNVQDVFTYTMRDADGDESTAELTINVGFNPVPQNLQTQDLTTDETDLDDNGTESDSGVVTADFGADGPGTFEATDASTFAFSGDAANGQLTSCGFPVTVTLVGDQYIGTANGATVFTLDIASDGSYTFNLLGQLDHADTNNPNEPINLEFGVTARDSNGDTATGIINVTVLDDAPSVNNLTLNVDETDLDDNGTEDDSGVITFDLGLDDGGTVDPSGASTFTAGGSLAGGALTSEGAPVTVTLVGDQYVGTANGATVFTLTINNDGSTTFDLLGQLDHADTTNPDDVINLEFGVTVTDKDGDTAEAVVTVNVNDDGPSVTTPLALCVDESVLDATGTANDTGTLTYDLGLDDGGTVEATDASTFTAGGSLAGGALTSEGNPVTVTLVNGQYIGTANGQTVFTLDITSNGTYTFNLLGTLDHADTTDPNDLIDLNFGITVTDGDGDSVETTLLVQIHDDGPVAADDVVNVASGQANATGNVLTNDDAGADDSDVAVLDITFGGTTVAAGQPIAGQYGTLTVNDDGTFTYTPNGNNNGHVTDVFTYTMRDADGDEDTAVLRINVGDNNDTPQDLRTQNLVTDETDLDDNGVENATGTATADFGNDGPGTFEATDANTFSFSGDVAGGQLTSCGFPVTVTLVGDQYIGTANGQTVFTLDIASNGEYVFNLLGQLDHGDTNSPNEALFLNFGITARDADGDTATGSIRVTVRDDAPEIQNTVTLNVDETDLFDNGSESDSGQVTADFGLDDGGTIDAAGANTFVAGGSLAGGQLTSDGAPVTVTLVGDQYVGTANGATVFTLDINDSGSYTFNLLGTLDHADGTDPDDVITLEFGVIVTDKDGDTDEATITVNVNDDGPAATHTFCAVDETNFDNGNTISVSGQLKQTGGADADFGADGEGDVEGNNSFNTTDAPFGNVINLTSEGNPVSVVWDANAEQYVGTANGATVFTLSLSDTGAYTYTQFAPIDHPDDTDANDRVVLNFGVTVTDADGDSVETTIQIDVYDDGPVAVNDVLNVAPGQASANGNVLTNDDAGADDSDVAVLDVTFGGNTVTAGNSIAGQYGTLTVNADGSYTYTPNGNNNGNVTDVFTYTMRDADGDESTAELRINVGDNDDTPQNLQVQNLVTDETDLDNNGVENASGTATADFGNDGPGTFDATGASTFSFSGNTGGALTSCGFPVTVALVNGQYVGTANGQTVFTMDIASNGSYTFNLLGQLDHSNTNSTNESLFLNFGITATDADGDTATGSIRVTVQDDAPTVGNVTLRVDETVVDNAGSDTESGSITVDFGLDDGGTIEASGANTFNAGGSLLGGNLTSNGVAVVVALVGTQYVGTANGATVFTLDINNNGSYTFDLVGTLDHADGTNPNDVIDLQFGVTVTDKDGDTDESVITVYVNDDGPVAADDVLNVAAGQTTGTGNVLSNDDAGNDDGDVAVLDVTFGGNTVTAGNSIAGQYGTLTVNADGSYTYTSNGTNNGNVTDVFTYTMRDADGDTDTAVLRINVGDNDDQPQNLQTEDLLTDETDLHDNGSESDSGTVTADFGNDGPGTFSATGAGTFSFGGDVTGGSLTSCGEPVTVSLVNGQYVGTAVINGVTETVFTLDINANGNYTFNLLGSLDHADTNNPNEPINLNFGVTATDADGDTATGTINVTVLDDAPTATDTYCSVYETNFDNGNTLSVSGQLKQAGGATFDYGQDGPGGIEGNNSFTTTDAPFGNVINLTSDGNPVSVVWNASTSQYVGTANGQTVFTLSVDDTGAYTYTQFAAIDHPDTNSNGERVVLNFGIDVTDKDGDSVSTTIQVDVYDDGPQLTNTEELCVDETNLPGESDTGTITADFGADGVGDVYGTGANTFSYNGSVANGQLTSNGNPVSVSVNGAGDYVGTAGGNTVFTLTFNPSGSYTFNLLGELDHADPNDPNDIINLVFGVTAEDGDGDTDTGTITVKVADDQPTVINGTPTIGDATGSVDESNFGNHLAANGSVAVNFGTDGAGEVCLVDGTFTALDAPNGNAITLQSNGQNVNVSLNANGDYVGTVGNTTIFTMSLNGNSGNYQFRMFETLDHLDPNDPNDQLYLQFGTKITDSDGDLDTGVITISVADDGPAAVNTFCIQKENFLGQDIHGQLKSGINGTDVDFGADGGEVSANIQFHATYDLNGSFQSITSNGHPVSVVYDHGTDQYVGVANGHDIFTLSVRPDGSYTYNQTQELDHNSTTGNVLYLNFGVDVTDGDGDVDAALIQVDVYDSTGSHHKASSSSSAQDANDALSALDDVSILASNNESDVEVTVMADILEVDANPVLQDSIDSFLVETGSENILVADAVDASQSAPITSTGFGDTTPAPVIVVTDTTDL